MIQSRERRNLWPLYARRWREDNFLEPPLAVFERRALPVHVGVAHNLLFDIFWRLGGT